MQNKNLKSGSFLKNPFLWLFFILGLVGGAVIVQVVTNMFLSNEQPVKAVQNNVFAQQAQKAGVITCLPLVSSLGETMTQGSQFSALTYWNKNKPDNHSYTAVVGQFYNDIKAQAAGVVFAAPINGSCEALMVRTVVQNENCKDIVLKQIPKDAKKQKDLAGVAVFNVSGKTNIMLMPVSQNSCVVMTTLNVAN